MIVYDNIQLYLNNIYIVGSNLIKCKTYYTIYIIDRYIYYIYNIKYIN